nr:hypothetical protein [Brevibacillus laterosporus]
MVKKKDEKVKNETSNGQEQLIYCGPNVPGGILMRYTVFRGGKPDYLQDLFTNLPGIEELIVPLSEFTEVLNNTMIVGTREHQLCQEIAQYNGQEAAN